MRPNIQPSDPCKCEPLGSSFQPCLHRTVSERADSDGVGVEVSCHLSVFRGLVSVTQVDSVGMRRESVCVFEWVCVCECECVCACVFV